MRAAAKRRLGRAGGPYAEREGNFSKASIVKDQAARLLGLPGISLADWLAQFQLDLARRKEEGLRTKDGVKRWGPLACR
jgi:hypothetical protein